jgi:hypothetical protein
MAEMLAIFMIVPVFIYTGPFWWLDLVVLAVLYLITLYALHRSWRKFPWPEQMRELEKTKSKRNPGQSVQWPFDRLNGYSPRKLYNLREIIILSLLIGWDRFAVLDGIHDPDLNDPREIALAFALIGGGAALFRAIVYVGCGLPPLSLLGRIVLRRPIIPTYDRIFLAPIGIALTAALLPILLTAIGLYPPLMAAFTAAVLFTMLAALPPRLRNWQLTGHSRMLIIRPKRAPASTVIVDRGRASRASRFES